MRGRIRITAVGLVAMTLVCAVSASAGGQSTTWSVQSNGGFVSLDLLNTLQFAGGGLADFSQFINRKFAAAVCDQPPALKVETEPLYSSLAAHKGFIGLPKKKMTGSKALNNYFDTLLCRSAPHFRRR